MQDTQVVEERAANQQKEAQASASKSSFDDAEYERWSQSLRNKSRSNGK
jgi:hypothetical protein